MCTCLLAGKNATAYGTVLLGANDDWSGVPGVLTRKNGGRHAPGEQYRLVGGRTVPQAAETFGYSYTACKYDIGILDRGWAGGVNDNQVAVAGTGASAFKMLPCDENWLEPDDVPLLILERARTAREGIRLVGDLIRQHGFRPSGLDECRSMCCFAVADPEEGWWLEMAPGDHWVAVRVPDGEASVRENAYGIHDADLTDRENVMCSEGLAEFARDRGWWNGDPRHFDFAAAYGAEESPNEWGPELDPMNMRRRWRAMCLLSGHDTPEDALLYSVTPDRKLTVEDFKAVLRDTYEGTAYDLSKATGAGMYGDPFHDDPPSYSLCRDWTVASIAVRLRREGPGTMWTCMANPRIGFYFPVFTGISGLPAACENAAPGVPEAPSLFWAFRELAFLTQRRYARYIPTVREAQARYEAESETLEAACPPGGREALTRERIRAAMELCRAVTVELEYQY